MRSHWYYLEKLAAHFHHEWAGFFTWLRCSGDWSCGNDELIGRLHNADGNVIVGWNGVERTEQARAALKHFLDWDGSGDLYISNQNMMGYMEITEAYEYWTEEVCGLRYDRPAGLTPASWHETGTGRYQWHYCHDTEELRFAIYRPQEMLAVYAEVKISDDYPEITTLRVYDAAEPRHEGYMAEMLVAVMGPHCLPSIFEAFAGGRR